MIPKLLILLITSLNLAIPAIEAAAIEAQVTEEISLDEQLLDAINHQHGCPNNWCKQPGLRNICDNLRATEIKTFLNNGANPNAVNAQGNTALMLASSMRKTKIMSILLEHKADINATNERGSTALAIAVLAGITESIETLLKAGADIPDNFDKYPQDAANLLEQEIQRRKETRLVKFAGKKCTAQATKSEGAGDEQTTQES